MLYDMDFLKNGKTFPPEEETERLQLYDSNRKLWKGDKSDFKERYLQLFGPEDLTVWQFNFNWYKKVSKLFADLLFGEPPVIICGDKEQDFLDTIINQSNLISVGHSIAIDLSRYGDAIFKPILQNNMAVIDSLSPGYWFPVFDPQTRKKIMAHFIVWQIENILYVEVHTSGQLEYRKYSMKDDKIGNLIESVVTNTNVDSPLIVPVHNLMTSEDLFGIDDYGDIETIVCELETRFSQWARILDKHSDPNVYGPSSLIKPNPVTGEAQVDLVNKYIGLRPGDTPPGYLVWDAQLSAVVQEIDQLMKQFYALSETSPALFGELQAGLAQSGTALQRLLLAPLMKVNRLRNTFDKKIKEVLSLASQLAVENDISNAVLINAEDIQITWQDGLPNDFTEQVANESTAVNSGLTSQESAMMRLYGLRGQALIDEMNKVKAEQTAKQTTNQPNPPGLKLPTLAETLNANK
jgi:hypothetical protein